MNLTFLGTGAGAPSRHRNVSSMALRLPERGDLWLFDCGEGTQHQFIRSDLRISRVSRIFITHLHGDHLFGLIGLLSTCSLAGDPKRIDIHGPEGLEEYIEVSLRLSGTTLGFPYAVHEVREGMIVEDGGFTVRCRRLLHRMETFGYRVDEPERAGRFDTAAAAALGIPPGPIYGQLKHGEKVVLEDGREIDGAGLCGPVERGRSVVYATDTIYTPEAVELARGADLLIHEATFSEADREIAELSLHSTAAMAARVAREADVGRLLLTHISVRYPGTNGGGTNPLLDEARAIFPATDMAADFMNVELPRHA
ncbi:MAG: ribonuclease [Chlorobi bacterium]|nr:ribonuclease [Chlorobiota bacterium]